MYRYLALGAIAIVVLAFLAPIVIDAGRKVRDKMRKSWK